MQCARCGLIYFDDTDYPEPRYDLEYNNYFHRAGDIRKAGNIAALIADLMKKHDKRQNILEIGPGNGLTAFLLAQQGFEVTTIDTALQSCFKIMLEFKIPSWPGKFETSRLEQQFDFIFAGHVIEHSENPLLFFRKAWETLKDKGLFFFDTPDSYFARKHGKEWKHFNTRNPYEHCCIFSMRTIEYISQTTGFEILTRERLEKFESMQVLLRKKDNGLNIN